MRPPIGTRPRLERAQPALRASMFLSFVVALFVINGAPWWWTVLLGALWLFTGTVGMLLLLDPRLGPAWRILALKVLELCGRRWSWRRGVGRVLRLVARLLVRTPGRLGATLVRSVVRAVSAAAEMVSAAAEMVSAARDRLEGDMLDGRFAHHRTVRYVARLERDVRSSLPVAGGVLTVTRRNPWRGPSEQQVQQVAQHWRSTGAWPDPQCQRRWSSHHRGRS